MSIKSEPGKGLIYAGDTPLACDINIQQSGPMQLVAKAGSFTTTGQAKIIDPKEPKNKTKLAKLNNLKTKGHAEDLPDGRMRVWMQREDGSLVDKCKTCSCLSDTVINIPLAAMDKYYRVDLGEIGGVSSVILREVSRLHDPVDAPPVGWSYVHMLTLPFKVPGGTIDLSTIDIYYLKVIPRFPIEKEEWII